MNEDSANDNTCWICLDVCEETDRKCGCTNGICHKQCLAIWQMRNCGKKNASKCQFCQQTLPDWRENITPKYATIQNKHVTLKARAADKMLMVNISGSISEQDLEALFEATIQKLTMNTKKFHNVYFKVNDPFGQGTIEFQGFSASHAVVYCAVLSVVSRRKKKATFLSCFGLD